MGRAAAHVHGHVEHLAHHHLHQLALGMGMLQMQAAQYAVAGTRHVVLHEGAGDARLGIAPLLPGLHEPAPLIPMDPRLDNQYAGNVGFLDIHRIRSRSKPSR